MGSAFILVQFPVSECANCCGVPTHRGCSGRDALRMNLKWFLKDGQRCVVCCMVLGSWVHSWRSGGAQTCWKANSTRKHPTKPYGPVLYSNKYSKWRIRRCFSLGMAIKMYFLIVAFLVGEMTMPIWHRTLCFLWAGGCWLRLFRYQGSGLPHFLLKINHIDADIILFLTRQACTSQLSGLWRLSPARSQIRRKWFILVSNA